MKIFEFHDSIFKRSTNRPYHLGTWEPLRMESFRLLPFQYEKSGTDLFQMYHVQDVETDITSFFDGYNLITGWTKTGTGTFTSSSSDYNITSFVPNACDYLTSNEINLTAGQNLHFKISGTFPAGNVKYSLFSGSDYVTGTSAKATEFTHEIESSGAYNFRIEDIGSANADITNGVPKMALSTLDIHGDFVTYNGGMLSDLVPRGKCYFRIADGNGLYSDDCQVDCVNSILTGWPEYFTNSVETPVYFTKEGKDVTRFQPATTTGPTISQAPRSNLFDVQKGEVIRLVFKHENYENWTDITAPVCYFRYTDGTTVNGSVDNTNNPITGNRDHVYFVVKFTASKTGTGQLYIEPISSGGSTVYDMILCDMYKTYSDKCTTISISSPVDFNGTYYRGGFTQKLHKESTVQRSPASHIEIIGEQKNGKLIKEKITTATKFVMSLKVSEPEFEALLEASSGEWQITDQTGRVFNAYNIEVEDPVWYQGNGTCRVVFEDNVSVYTLNNEEL